jgi:transposase
LRDYTRLRTDLTRDHARHWQRLEKLLEDALIKVSAVASTMDTLSVRDMLEALIAGQRDPKVLAGLARGMMNAKRAALIEALTGKFDDHHAELARMLLDHIDALTAQIGTLTTQIEELIAAIPAPGESTPTAPQPDATAVLTDVKQTRSTSAPGRRIRQLQASAASRTHPSRSHP